MKDFDYWKRHGIHILLKKQNSYHSSDQNLQHFIWVYFAYTNVN